MRNTCSMENCERFCVGRGYCGKHYQRNRTHGDPLTLLRQPNGNGTIARGYRVYSNKEGKKLREHVLIAERALGRPLPAGAVVHHVDQNPLNNRNDNLVICPSVAYHAELHARLTALRACGHADWRKCVYCPRYDDTNNMVREKCGRYVHRACSARVRRNNVQKRKSQGATI